MGNKNLLVLPAIAVFNLAYNDWASSKLSGYFALKSVSIISILKSFFNFINLCLSKNSARAFLSGAIRPSSFRFYIPHIVLMGSKKQMVRPNTCTVIAFMKSVKSIFNWANMHKIRQSVCSYLPRPLRTSRINSSISFLLSSNPIPAISKMRNMCRNRPVFINLFPKSFDYCVSEFESM